jgi:type I restriction enzyme S subunit
VTTLPSGWIRAPLGSLVDVLDHRRVPVNAEERARRPGVIPYYGATGQVGWIDDHLFDEELVLLGEDGAPFLDPSKPKAYVVSGRSWVNNHAHVLRGREVSNRLLAHQLNVLDFHGAVSGTTRLKLPQGPMRSLMLVVPPRAEQDRIVAAIEQHLSDIDAGVASLERVQANLKRYRASVLKAACEGKLVSTEAELARKEGRAYESGAELLKRILVERRARWEADELAKMTAKGKVPVGDAWKKKYVEPTPPETKGRPALPDGWCWTTIATVGEVLLGRQRAPQYLTGKWSRPYLRVANVKDDRLDFGDVEQMDFDPTHLAKYRLEPGDILVSEGQSLDRVGESAIYRGGIDGLCFQKTLHRFRPMHPGPTSEFAQIVFRSHVKNGLFRKLASITTNIAHLTLEKFEAAPFPLPPAAEQARIVDEVARLMSVADDAERVVQQQLARAARLRQAVLRDAFEGKLVRRDEGRARRGCEQKGPERGRQHALSSASAVLARPQTEGIG